MTNTITLCEACSKGYHKVCERADPCEFCGATQHTAVYDLNRQEETARLKPPPQISRAANDIIAWQRIK